MRWALVLLLTTGFLTGCGEDQRPNPDEAEIRQVVEREATSQKPEEVCRSYTARFAEERFAEAGRCEVLTHWTIVFENKFDAGMTPEIRSLDIEGSSARAHVRYTFDGVVTDGHIQLRKIADAWKIEAWEADLVRSHLETLFRTRYDRRVLPALNDPASRKCLQRWTDSLDDHEARGQMFPVGDPTNQRRAYTLLKSCVVPQSRRRNVLRDYFENEIRLNTEVNDRPASEGECLVEHSHELTEKQLLDYYANSSAAVTENMMTGNIKCLGQSD